MFKKTIISEFFTTISFHQYLSSLWIILFRLPSLRYWKSIQFVEKEILMYLNREKSKIISLYNWRSALYQALKIIWIKKSDEVIVTAYTCVSVINAVIQSWAKIIYSDIEETTLWIDPIKLNKNITKNTKVIVVQHTFGKAAQIERIWKIAKEKKILIIEDCAHSLWSIVDGVKLGWFADFSIFSTGRDKVISSVTGWFLVINNQKYFKKIDTIKAILKIPSRKRVIKDIMYNIFAYKAYKLYDFFSIGKWIIFITRKLWLINEIITQKEKNCQFQEFNYILPNSLAFLVSKELERIKVYSNYKKLLAEYYNSNIKSKYLEKIYKPLKNEKNNYFRYPIILKSSKQKNKFYAYMKKNNILLWNYWSWNNIVPAGVNEKNTRYKTWSCTVSEDISSRIVTIPNHKLVSIKDMEKIISLINKFK